MRKIIKLGGLVLAIGLAASACHVGGGYTVGGAVTGLSGSGLVLQLNGGNNLGFSSGGTFNFSAGIDQGGAYSVTSPVRASTSMSLSDSCALAQMFPSASV